MENCKTNIVIWKIVKTYIVIQKIVKKYIYMENCKTYIFYMENCKTYIFIWKTPRETKHSRLLENQNLLLTIFGSRHCMSAYFSWFREEGWKYFSKVFLFLFYHTNFMNKQLFKNFILTLKTKNNSLTINFFNLQNHPTFQSRRKVG